MTDKSFHKNTLFLSENIIFTQKYCFYDVLFPLTEHRTKPRLNQDQTRTKAGLTTTKVSNSHVDLLLRNVASMTATNGLNTLKIISFFYR